MLSMCVIAFGPNISCEHIDIQLVRWQFSNHITYCTTFIPKWQNHRISPFISLSYFIYKDSKHWSIIVKHRLISEIIIAAYIRQCNIYLYTKLFYNILYSTATKKKKQQMGVLFWLNEIYVVSRWNLEQNDFVIARAIRGAANITNVKTKRSVHIECCYVKMYFVRKYYRFSVLTNNVPVA